MARSLTLEELVAADALEKAARQKDTGIIHASVSKSASKGKPDREVHSTRRAFQRPPHAVVLLVLASVIAYGLLAVGWGLRAVGDCVWQVGEWIHEDKWGIK